MDKYENNSLHVNNIDNFYFQAILAVTFLAKMQIKCN